MNFLVTSDEVTRMPAYKVEVKQEKLSRFKMFAQKNHIRKKNLYIKKEEMVNIKLK